MIFIQPTIFAVQNATYDSSKCQSHLSLSRNEAYPKPLEIFNDMCKVITLTTGFNMITISFFLVRTIILKIQSLKASNAMNVNKNGKT